MKFTLALLMLLFVFGGDISADTAITCTAPHFNPDELVAGAELSAVEDAACSLLELTHDAVKNGVETVLVEYQNALREYRTALRQVLITAPESEFPTLDEVESYLELVTSAPTEIRWGTTLVHSYFEEHSVNGMVRRMCYNGEISSDTVTHETLVTDCEVIAVFEYHEENETTYFRSFTPFGFLVQDWTTVSQY